MTTSKNSNANSKPKYTTIPVTLSNGSIVNVCRVKLDKLVRLTELQSELANLYVEHNGFLGSILSVPENVTTLREFVEMLPISGTEDFLKYSDLEDNWEQLVKLAFNSNIDYDTRKAGQMEASLVCSLHFLSLGDMIQETVEKITKENQAKALKILSEEKENRDLASQLLAIPSG